MAQQDKVLAGGIQMSDVTVGARNPADEPQRVTSKPERQK
jgi:hypothetical protein